MAKIISLTNSKGGAGKSTMTIFIASILAKLDNRVLIVDCDEQKSIIDAYNIAKEAGDDVRFDVLELNANSDDFFDDLESLSEEFDYIFIDMPGRGHDNAVKRILYAIEYAIIPMGYGDTDISAGVEFINSLLSIQQEMRKQDFDIKIGLFFNNHKKTNKSDDTIKAFMQHFDSNNNVVILKDENNTPITIMNREIYKTLDFGHTPLELSKTFKTKHTINEFEQLLSSILNFLNY